MTEHLSSWARRAIEGDYEQARLEARGRKPGSQEQRVDIFGFPVLPANFDSELCRFYRVQPRDLWALEDANVMELKPFDDCVFWPREDLPVEARFDLKWGLIASFSRSRKMPWWMKSMGASA